MTATCYSIPSGPAHFCVGGRYKYDFVQSNGHAASFYKLWTEDGFGVIFSVSEFNDCFTKEHFP